MDKKRTIITFLVAPLMLPLVFFVFLAITLRVPHVIPGLTKRAPYTWEYVILSSVLMSWIGLPIAYLAELVLGWPAWLVLRYLETRSLIAFTVVGALIGLIVGLAISLLFHVPGDPSLLPLCVVGGAASGTLFRIVAFSDSSMDTRSKKRITEAYYKNPFVN